ncbi:MAG: hypothetical protein Q7J75_01260 [Rhodoferax sp.]|nr:hypothetical protein [Rhodoferax sp.]
MAGHSASAIVDQLRGAGLNLSLARTGGLAVAPASQLTEELRALIRDSKTLLIDWVKSANDAGSAAPEPPSNPASPTDWHALDAAYLAHHFNCPTCIAAGRGSHYGLRCGVGTSLWRAYAQADQPGGKKCDLTRNKD